jgi:dihydroxyacetone kinase
MGIHGEQGIRRTKLQSADEMAHTMVDLILADSEIGAGDKVCTLVNGLGATSLAELYILNHRLHGLLTEKGVHIHHMDVNSYVTCQEMAGASVTLFKLDEELERYYNMPCYSPHYSMGWGTDT